MKISQWWMFRVCWCEFI